MLLPIVKRLASSPNKRYGFSIVQFEVKQLMYMCMSSVKRLFVQSSVDLGSLSCLAPVSEQTQMDQPYGVISRNCGTFHEIDTYKRWNKSTSTPAKLCQFGIPMSPICHARITVQNQLVKAP